MTFSHALFQLLIYPLQLIYEFIFFYAKLFTGSTGVSIIVLSIVVNFMLLPLYSRADAIQNEEREQEKRMDYWIRHIKKTFSGNERFMMLQTYYRQNHYKPYYTLKGMLPLILEIPFFIAAYHYLSGLSDLNVGFGPISNMSTPDALLHIGGTSINILPIIMTLINIISAAIYTKGLRFKDKLQLYGMAALFLVLLYDSPSGLVLYWTLNNIFSLVKNIIWRLKNKYPAVGITLSLIGFAAISWAVFMPKDQVISFVPMLVIGILLQLPLVIILLRSKLTKIRFTLSEREPNPPLYIGGCLSLTLLTGTLIPSSVIVSSPSEFSRQGMYYDPLLHLLNSLLLSAGMFMIWFGLLYYLSGKKGRCVLEFCVWIVSGIAVVDYMFFGTNLGMISKELIFNHTMAYTAAEILINTAVIAAAAVLMTLLWKKNRNIVKKIYVVLVGGVVVLAGINAAAIKSVEGNEKKATDYAAKSAYAELPDKLIHLSKNKKNVIVLMMDRAIGYYIPYILNEKPELRKQFDGFTYYPNTLSYGISTNTGSPSLFGGYEYTPSAMNARSSELIADKHNEAIKLMPDLFYNNGFDVTVIEPPYAGYRWIPDLSIYDEYEGMKTYNVEEGQMTGMLLSGSTQVNTLNDIWNRNFFCYSLMKISPCFMQPWVYQNGLYHSKATVPGTYSDMSFVSAISNDFLNSYSVLYSLPTVTECTDTEKDTFLMMSNSTTHEPQLLSEPDYVPVLNSDNTEYDNAHKDRFTLEGRTIRVENAEQMAHYHVNVASMIQLGRWLDYLRSEGVYDNTRIIITADHAGYKLYQIDDLVLDREKNGDAMSFNPLLLVKDFNSKGFTTDNTFMTNADTPTLAFDSLVKDPVNPFTGNPVTNTAKQGEQYVFSSDISMITRNNGYTYRPGQWYSVHDNIFDINNWTKRDWH